MIRRGDVWWVNFGPGRGGEIRKRRPAIIVSVDSANRSINRVQAVPTTGSTGRLYPSEAFVTIGGKRSKAMADQLATIAKERLISRIGALSPTELAGVEQAIRVQLGL